MPDLDSLVARLRRHVRDMPPHRREREAGQLMQECLDALDAPSATPPEVLRPDALRALDQLAPMGLRYALDRSWSAACDADHAIRLAWTHLRQGERVVIRRDLEKAFERVGAPPDVLRDLRLVALTNPVALGTLRELAAWIDAQPDTANADAPIP